jgi:hypothetical protein
MKEYNDHLVAVSDDRDILHIVSCYSAEGTLRASGVPAANVIVWFDLLTLGPTVGTSLEETTKARHRFFRKEFKSWPLPDDPPPVLPTYIRRNRMLRRCGEWREVALWFGPAVIEQFSLLQVLATIGEQKLTRTRISLVTCPTGGIPIYRPEEMATFFNSRPAIPLGQVANARKAWGLYCGSNPALVLQFAKKHAKSLPILSKALLCQLEQYPSVKNGLSFSEEALLREVDARRNAVRAVGYVLGNDDDYRTGDEELFKSIFQFLGNEVPLIEMKGKELPLKSFADFRKLELGLSAAGLDVLAGKADQIALNGIDRWIGGVHLHGKVVPWRWDADNRSLKKC